MSNLKCHPIRKVTAGVCFEVGLLRRVTCLVVTGEFYILVTVHLGIISINNQLDAQFLLYIFIWILYMFSATLCSSSGESIISLQHLVYVSLCRWPSGMQVGKGETIVSIQRLVYISLCRWPSGVQVGKELVPSRPAYRTVTYTDWHMPDVVLIQLTLLMMGTRLLETCRESK